MSTPTTGPTDAQDAALLLIWAGWADDQQLDPNLAALLRRIAKRLGPNVQLGDVVKRSPDHGTQT